MKNYIGVGCYDYKVDKWLSHCKDLIDTMVESLYHIPVRDWYSLRKVGK